MALLANLPKCQPLAKHNRPGKNRKAKQHDQYRQRKAACLGKHTEKRMCLEQNYVGFNDVVPPCLCRSKTHKYHRLRAKSIDYYSSSMTMRAFVSRNKSHAVSQIPLPLFLTEPVVLDSSSRFIRLIIMGSRDAPPDKNPQFCINSGT